MFVITVVHKNSSKKINWILISNYKYIHNQTVITVCVVNFSYKETKHYQRQVVWKQFQKFSSIKNNMGRYSSTDLRIQVLHYYTITLQYHSTASQPVSTAQHCISIKMSVWNLQQTIKYNVNRKKQTNTEESTRKSDNKEVYHIKQ